MKRRQFIRLGAAAMAGLGLGACTSRITTSHVQQPLVYSGFDDEEGHHYFGLLNLQTQQLRSVKMAFRGHDVLQHPLRPNRAILFGRRPETRCCEVDFQTLEVREISISAYRHFYGHGCFSADHLHLFTTENNFNRASGVIGIRDATTFKYLGEFPSYGIGPHDIQLMPDGKTLVIANGGIQTHPDFGRRKLNLKTMRPSLVYIDAESGEKLGQYTLPDSQLSIRHLLITPSGDVGVALQYQGKRLPTSLVAWQKQGQDLRLLKAPTTVIRVLNGYMADLAFSPTSNILLATSPRGNQVMVWDVNNGRYLKNIPVTEPSGVFFLEQENSFVISNSAGKILALDAETLQLTKTFYQNSAIKWDNHMQSNS